MGETSKTCPVCFSLFSFFPFHPTATDGRASCERDIDSRLSFCVVCFSIWQRPTTSQNLFNELIYRSGDFFSFVGGFENCTVNFMNYALPQFAYIYLCIQPDQLKGCRELDNHSTYWCKIGKYYNIYNSI